MEKIEKIEKDVKHKENILRKFGVEINQLPENAQNILNKIGIIKYYTNIHNLDESFIEEWSFHRRQEDIDANYNNFLMQKEISELEQEIEAEEKEIRKIEIILKNSDNKTESEMQKAVALMQNDYIKSQKEQQKLSQTNKTAELDLNNIIAKVEKL